MLFPLLFAAGPDEPATPPTPREPEVAPPDEPPTAPDPEPPSEPDPHVVPPGVPFREPGPEPEIPEGPGLSDPDLAPGAPLSLPAFAPTPPEETDVPSDWFAPYDTASLPPDHPAYDRLQSRSKAGARRRRLPLVVGFLLVLVGLLVTYLLLGPKPGDGEVPDLLTLAAAQAGAVRPEVATSDLDEAEDYIMDEFGWPIRVPVLPNARLDGVGVVALMEGIEVPALRYLPAQGAPVTVYAYDYAFLDAAADHLRLAPPVYARLAEEPPVDVRRVGDVYLVLWRRRAAIYTAVTADDPAPLVEYLSRR